MPPFFSRSASRVLLSRLDLVLEGVCECDQGLLEALLRARRLLLLHLEDLTERFVRSPKPARPCPVRPVRVRPGSARSAPSRAPDSSSPPRRSGRGGPRSS